MADSHNKCACSIEYGISSRWEQGKIQKLPHLKGAAPGESTYALLLG